MLWEVVEGKRSEDLATEVLAFILQAPQFVPLQKLVYQFLFADGLVQSTVERAFEITTQESYPGHGRLDLMIQGGSVRLIVESKFDADFSQGDQLHRYVTILKGCDEQQRILILLCPERNRLSYESKALSQFRSELGEVESLQSLADSLLSQYGIVFKVLTWDRLVTLLECDAVLVAELVDFVRYRALTAVEFSSKELKMLMSDEIPKLIFSIFQTVAQVRGRIEKEFITGSMGQSRKYFGFNIDCQGCRFWFGYSLQQWLRTKTPFSIQFNKTWMEGNKQISEEVLTTAGFTNDKEWVCPLVLTEADTDPVFSLATQVQDKIRQVLRAAIPGHQAS